MRLPLRPRGAKGGPRGSRAAGPLLVAWPMAAHACSVCTDTMLNQQVWWLAAGTWVLGLAVAEAALASLTGPRLSGAPRVASRSLALLALVVGVVGTGLAAYAGLAAMALVLLVRAFVVGAATVRRAPAWAGVRLAVLAAGTVVAVVMARPAARSTEDLVSLLTRTPYRLEPSSWALAELERRADEALVAVDARLTHASPGRQMAVLLELHRRTGGDARVRRGHCERYLAAASPGAQRPQACPP